MPRLGLGLGLACHITTVSLSLSATLPQALKISPAHLWHPFKEGVHFYVLKKAMRISMAT